MANEILREQGRQLVHIGLGIIFIAVTFILGRNAIIMLAFFSLVIGSLLINMAFQGKKFFLVQWAERFERKNVEFPGYGSAWYMIGVLLLATFLREQSEIATGIFLLGISDGLSTIVGLHGIRKLPYNQKKTFEGSIAFFISALVTYIWIGYLAIPLALLAALVEGLQLPLDDNITVPIAIVAFLLLF